MVSRAGVYFRGWSIWISHPWDRFSLLRTSIALSGTCIYLIPLLKNQCVHGNNLNLIELFSVCIKFVAQAQLSYPWSHWDHWWEREMAALESMSLFEEQRIHLLMCPSSLQASLQSVSNRKEREREREIEKEIWADVCWGNIPPWWFGLCMAQQLFHSSCGLWWP